MQTLHELVFPLENDSLANNVQPDEKGQMQVITDTSSHSSAAEIIHI